MTPSVPATASPSSAPSAPRAPEPLHGCVRCGARIPVSESMCERCNPLGLKAPAASQAHGTVFLGIGLAVVIMAVAARAMFASVGPFPSSVVAVDADPAGLRVTISVANDGSAAARTTCRIADPALPGIGPETAFVQSPMVDAHGSTTFEAVVTTFGSQPKPLTAVCGS